jgi:hypothetical protein
MQEKSANKTNERKQLERERKGTGKVGLNVIKRKKNRSPPSIPGINREMTTRCKTKYPFFKSHVQRIKKKYSIY